ncbi:MAG: hypothetical protein D8B49_02405, partial [Riemerella sp.]
MNKKNQKDLFSNIKLIIFAVLIFHRGVIRGAEVFQVDNEWFRKYFKKSLKIFCQFKKTLYFCT